MAKHFHEDTGFQKSWTKDCGKEGQKSIEKKSIIKIKAVGHHLVTDYMHKIQGIEYHVNVFKEFLLW